MITRLWGGTVQTVRLWSGTVDSFVPYVPGEAHSLDFSDADNSMYLALL